MKLQLNLHPLQLDLHRLCCHLTSALHLVGPSLDLFCHLKWKKRLPVGPCSQVKGPEVVITKCFLLAPTRDRMLSVP